MLTQHITTPEPIVSDSNLPDGNTPQGSHPSDSVSPTPFPLGTVPPGLNHCGKIPPGHYPFRQIPFLFPPPRVYSTPIMSTLSLPNITLGILVWYNDPPANTPPNQLKPYTSLTPVQPVVPTLIFDLVPQKPQ